jgi:hypothetical protein
LQMQVHLFVCVKVRECTIHVRRCAQQNAHCIRSSPLTEIRFVECMQGLSYSASPSLSLTVQLQPLLHYLLP